MYCRNCGSPLENGAYNCTKCGSAVGTGSAYCPHCASSVGFGVTACPHCGTNFDANQPNQQAYQQQNYQQPPYQQAYQQPPYQQAPPPYNVPYGYNQKSKMAAGLLGIFLGGFGVHNFYLGFTNKGVIQLVLTLFSCGIASIWGLIEGILILCGNINIDANGVPLSD